jgi:hypothetical protein
MLVRDRRAQADRWSKENRQWHYRQVLFAASLIPYRALVGKVTSLSLRSFRVFELTSFWIKTRTLLQLAVFPSISSL